MSRQHVEFKVSGTDKDSGEESVSAIKPVTDGEPGQATVFNRPTENLRTRTEFIRDELENLKYLSDADRALLLTSTGSITWNGLPTGTFSATSDLTLKPFLAPEVSTAARLIICAGTVGQITIRTRQDGLTGQPRAYNGANAISIDFTGVSSGSGTVTVTADGTPANNVHVTYDSHPTSGTTVNQNVGNSFLTQFNTSTVAVNLGLEAVVEGGGTPPEVGFPVPPASVAATLLSDAINGIQPAEMLTRFMSGAADAEKHNITPAQLVTFFSDSLNVLTEGDVVCLRYDDLVMAGDGGRRQSLDEFPENKADVAGNNLFLLRRFPARLPGALPVAAVINGNLIFVNGRSYLSGETGPLVAAGASYQGSPASPNSWADGTVVSGPVSFESALDTVIQTLGTKAGGTPGAIKIGFTPFGNIAADTVKGALEELDSEKAGLALTNAFTQRNTFTASVTNTNAIEATGNGNREGVKGIGGATGIGVLGWGNTSGAGVEGLGGSTGPGPGVKGTGGGSASGIGVVGLGTGTGSGVEGTGGGTNGIGVRGIGGITNGIGVSGEGQGTGAGVKGAGASGSAGPGVRGEGGSVAGYGVIGVGGPTGTGVRGEGGTSTGIGVQGIGTGTGHGVEGTSGNGVGSIGVVGKGATGTNNGGVKGEGGSTGGYGVYGLGVDAGIGVIGTGGGTTGIGVYGTSGGTGSTGVYGRSGTASGYGVEGAGRGEGIGVHGSGGTNTNTGGPTFSTTPVAGPGTGVAGFGALGSGGGDGGQFFGRTASGSTMSRTGVVAAGSYSQTTGINGGTGVAARGGNATVGNGSGGTGIESFGGTPIGTGQAGLGADIRAAAGTGSSGNVGTVSLGTGDFCGVWGKSGPSSNAKGVQGTTFASNGYGVYGDADVTVTNGNGVKGIGNGTGVGGEFVGGGTAPTNFATRKNGAGVTGIGATAGGFGFVGQGGSTSTIGVGLDVYSNAGVMGVGTGGGEGVIGISAQSTNAIGVRGVGSSGVNACGVSGLGSGEGIGVEGHGDTHTNAGYLTYGTAPTAGPGTGVAGYGATGTGGGDGGQFFGRMGAGATLSRAGVVGAGAYSQTTLVSAGTGVHGEGGDATVGNADGGHGLTANGGNAAGSGTGGSGIRVTGGIGTTPYVNRGVGVIGLGPSASNISDWVINGHGGIFIGGDGAYAAGLLVSGGDGTVGQAGGTGVEVQAGESKDPAPGSNANGPSGATGIQIYGSIGANAVSTSGAAYNGGAGGNGIRAYGALGGNGSTSAAAGNGGTGGSGIYATAGNGGNGGATTGIGGSGGYGGRFKGGDGGSGDVEGWAGIGVYAEGPAAGRINITSPGANGAAVYAKGTIASGIYASSTVNSPETAAVIGSCSDGYAFSTYSYPSNGSSAHIGYYSSIDSNTSNNGTHTCFYGQNIANTGLAAIFSAINSNRGTIRIAPRTGDPGSPQDGDIWVTGSALKIKIGGTVRTITISPP
jgi:hypothetical protein